MKKLLPLAVFIVMTTQASTSSDSLSSPPPEKNEATAYALATGVTLLTLLSFNSSGTFAGEILFPIVCPIVGPSLGQIYAGSWWQATIGASVRTIGLTIMVASFLGSAQCDQNCPSLTGPVTTGLIFLGGGIIYSFVDTHFAVKRANEKVRAKQTTVLFDLFPTLTYNTGSSHQMGMIARLSF